MPFATVVSSRNVRLRTAKGEGYERSRLELLITLDDPVDAPEEDIFHDLHAHSVTFGQADWSCTSNPYFGTPSNESK